MSESITTEEYGEHFRKAADEVWDMALQYEKRGLRELAEILKDLAMEIHNQGRIKQLNGEELL